MSKNYIVLDGKTIKKGGVRVRIEIRCFENPDGDKYELWENYGGGIEMPIGSETYKEINMVMDAVEKVAGIKYSHAFRTFLSSSFK